MYLAKTPGIVKPLGKNMIWNISTQEKVLYLTFDDGPVPEATPFVLDVLNEYNAKGTFFCVGENVKKHPKIFNRIIEEGHAIGNHTQNHLNGWKTKNFSYFRNALSASSHIPSRLFRPPYGKITRQQSISLRKRFDIVMWDVLSGDFDLKLSPEKCLLNVVHNAEKGSIIVFHDSKKAFSNMSYSLPILLDLYTKKGFKFEALSNESIQMANKKPSQHVIMNTVE